MDTTTHVTPRTIIYGGETWMLHLNGAIERPGLVRPNAATWRVLGAVERNNFGAIVRRYTLAEVLSGGVPWKWKNGKQRTFIRDFDHGSTREWRSGHSVR